MEQRKPKWRGPTTGAEIDELLTGRYAQLLKWGSVLTRGDTGKAQDIVQEFCLYFTVAKPDLSEVTNLDGYIYTCLRHIFLSSLARASREALHFVSTADFDSFDFALDGNRPGDLLQRQNDLRRICAYAVWRKQSSKSASYFILHFFHGYSRREIGEMVRLPLSAIYNKLKAVRSEVKSHLESAGKLRVVDSNFPSPPVLSWGLSSSIDLFRELRQTILQARGSDCVPASELIELYLSSPPAPLDCSLLAHIVSCEGCLAIIDRHFRRPTLSDREPLDSLESSGGSNASATGTSSVAQKATLRSVRKRWGGIHEHRPRSLSIAVNGQIIAFHDVQGEHSTLSARIEHAERAQFVEVFSEQDIRLAMLPIEELPPHNSSTRSQRVALSDDRWLELILTFDGLGLNGEVAYFDPALAVDQAEEEAQATLPAMEARLEPRHEGRSEVHGSVPWPRAAYAVFIRSLRALFPSSALAWALMVTIIVCTAGYFAYRHISPPINAAELLKQSVKVETASLQGQTEHQVFQIEELSAEGQVLQQGTVDQWKDGDGSRYVRRLYDSQNRLVATRGRSENGEDRRLQDGRSTQSNQSESPDIAEFLDQDLSAQSFRALEGNELRAHAVGGGYELSTLGPTEAHPQLVSAILTLDNHLLPVRQVVRTRKGNQIRELRLVQTTYELKPSSSVPDTVFDSRHTEMYPAPRLGGARSGLDQHFPGVIGNDVQLAELQIDVLYRLHALRADTGAPIEVVGTQDGRVRVSGTVADDALRREIISSLQASNSRQLLDLRLDSHRDTRLGINRRQRTQIVQTYDVTQSKFPADIAVRNYLQGKGLSGAKLDTAAEQFSNEMLQHSQAALQHAFALDRLGNVLSTAPLQSIGLSSRQQWSEMVNSHATGLEEQLRLLRTQLSGVSTEGEGPNPSEASSPKIEDAAEFERTVNALLRQTQQMNEYVGMAFASGPANEMQNPHPDALLAQVASAVPSRQADQVSQFAVRLNTSASAQLSSPGKGPGGMKVPDRRH